MSDKVRIKVLDYISLNGEVLEPGDIKEIDADVARNLKSKRKAQIWPKGPADNRAMYPQENRS